MSTFGSDTAEFDRVRRLGATRGRRPIAVLGGGPAGLTAGYLLAKRNVPVIVFEATDQVGGIAKTEVRDGFRFDLGGHRFFTKSKEVNDLWHEVLNEEFLLRPRLSRIYWNGKFLQYPLEGMDVIRKLGPIELDARGPLLPAGAAEAQGRRGGPRELGLQPLRQAPLRAVLQVLHREGVGRAVLGAARRMGRPAHQGPVVLLRRQGRLLRQQERDQVADLRVPLPALRARADVGDDGRRDHRRRRRGPHEHAGDADRHRRRGPRRRRPRRRRVRSRARTSSRPCRCA